MEIEVIDKKPNHLKLKIIGEDHTFCNALKEELWNDKTVQISGYTMEHALTDSPVLIISTKGAIKPKSALEKAVKRLQDKNKELLTAIKKIK